MTVGMTLQAVVRLDLGQNFAPVHPRQVQIQQDEIRERGGVMLRLAAQKRHGLDAVGRDVQTHRSIGIAKGLLRQAHIPGAVFHQKNLQWHAVPPGTTAHSSGPFLGNFTLVSQKSLMLLIRFSKASSCTGLLR